MVGDTDLAVSEPAPKTQAERFDQPDEQRVVEQLEIVLHPLPADVGFERAAQLAEPQIPAGRLSRVPARDADELLEQPTVPPASARAQVVGDDPPDDGLVELLGDVGPRQIL